MTTAALSTTSMIAAPVRNHQDRVDKECQQLLVDIRRVGDVEGAPYVTFGQLFEDEEVVQHYEALLGTLKSAKKRGLISFKGQMLLKGVHDSVLISIVGEEDSVPAESSSSSFQPTTNKATMAPIRKWKRPVTVQPVTPTVEASVPQKSKAYQGRKWSKPMSYSGSSSTKSNVPTVTPTTTTAHNSSYRTSASSFVSIYQTSQKSKSISTTNLNKENSKVNYSSRDPSGAGNDSSHNKNQARPLPLHSSADLSSSGSSKAAAIGGGSDVEAYHSRHEQELVQLLKDIRRVGCVSSGSKDGTDESCRFGDLFDDPEVEQYYEALLGTLKSAKRRGLITFKGQMLLKGMHDNVVIRIISNGSANAP